MIPFFFPLLVVSNYFWIINLFIKNMGRSAQSWALYWKSFFFIFFFLITDIIVIKIFVITVIWTLCRSWKINLRNFPEKKRTWPQSLYSWRELTRLVEFSKQTIDKKDSKSGSTSYENILKTSKGFYTPFQTTEGYKSIWSTTFIWWYIGFASE